MPLGAGLMLLVLTDWLEGGSPASFLRASLTSMSVVTPLRPVISRSSYLTNPRTVARGPSASRIAVSRSVLFCSPLMTQTRTSPFLLSAIVVMWAPVFTTSTSFLTVFKISGNDSPVAGLTAIASGGGGLLRMLLVLLLLGCGGFKFFLCHFLRPTTDQLSGPVSLGAGVKDVDVGG